MVVVSSYDCLWLGIVDGCSYPPLIAHPEISPTSILLQVNLVDVLSSTPMKYCMYGMLASVCPQRRRAISENLPRLYQQSSKRLLQYSGASGGGKRNEQKRNTESRHMATLGEKNKHQIMVTKCSNNLTTMTTIRRRQHITSELDGTGRSVLTQLVAKI